MIAEPTVIPSIVKTLRTFLSIIRVAGITGPGALGYVSGSWRVGAAQSIKNWSAHFRHR
jgi:hypothetical protein